MPGPWTEDFPQRKQAREVGSARQPRDGGAQEGPVGAVQLQGVSGLLDSAL